MLGFAQLVNRIEGQQTGGARRGEGHAGPRPTDHGSYCYPPLQHVTVRLPVHTVTAWDNEHLDVYP